MDEYIELIRQAEVAFRTGHTPPSDWLLHARYLLALADCRCPEGQGSMNGGVIYHFHECKVRHARAAFNGTEGQS